MYVICGLLSTQLLFIAFLYVSHAPQFNSLRVLVQREGLNSLFYGLSPMLAKQVPFTMAKQVSFDMFASMFYRTATGTHTLLAFPEEDTKIAISIASAFLASILACIVSHPGDVLLTERYKDRSNSTTSREEGFITVAANVYKNRGIKGYFAGLSARFIHVGAIITSQLVIYDYIKQALGLPATGS